MRLINCETRRLSPRIRCVEIPPGRSVEVGEEFMDHPFIAGNSPPVHESVLPAYRGEAVQRQGQIDHDLEITLLCRIAERCAEELCGGAVVVVCGGTAGGRAMNGRDILGVSIDDERWLRGDDIESLTSGLSRKMWQKIIILEHLEEGGVLSAR